MLDQPKLRNGGAVIPEYQTPAHWRSPVVCLGRT